MAWQIEFTDEARKQLKALDRAEAQNILRYCRQRLAPSENPRQQGKALRGELSSLWRYRVGNYRLICELRETSWVILVIRVGHRKEIYR